MKVFTFVSLLALALGSNVASAADSGSHTINLAVDMPDPLLSIVLANETVNIDMETHIASAISCKSRKLFRSSITHAVMTAICTF